MKFILGVNCVPNEECFGLFFSEYNMALAPMSKNYGGNLIRDGRYSMARFQGIHIFKTPKECRIRMLR